MAGPLCKSLPIGTYGYWQQVPDIVDTQIIEGVELLFCDTQYELKFDDEFFDISLDSGCFELKLDLEDTSLELDGGPKELDICE